MNICHPLYNLRAHAGYAPHVRITLLYCHVVVCNKSNCIFLIKHMLSKNILSFATAFSPVVNILFTCLLYCTNTQNNGVFSKKLPVVELAKKFLIRFSRT
jgi:hypothetical protein